MTLRDAISLMDYGFKKVAITTEVSGSDKLFHYFFLEFDKLVLYLQTDDGMTWYMSIDSSLKTYKSFYRVEKFIKALQELK